MSRPPVDLTPEQVSDPANGYPALRAEAPLVRVVLPGTTSPVWLATRFDDVRALMSDPRFVRDHRSLPGLDVPNLGEEMLAAYGLPMEYKEYLTSLVVLDGAEHARLRAKVTRTFAARRIKALRPLVEQRVDDLLLDLEGREQFDLMADFCYPIANRAVCDLLGVEEADQEQMCRWIVQYVSGSDPAEIISGLESVIGYTKDLIARRRREPNGDLISGMIEDKDPTTEAEMIAMVFLLINTGHTPPVLFLSSAVLALFDHPEELARLRAEPALLPNAVHELLRFTTPVTIGATAYATEDLEFSGVPVKRGEAVTYGLLAADHDPAMFPEPQRLDISRAPRHGELHLAFGGGAHYCLGAALARMQAEISLDRLLLRRKGFELAVGRDELEYACWPGEGNHLVRLPVRL
ncbi:MAG TPA: cytochrome P450 [Pseudonocardiaceae bacterium]